VTYVIALPCVDIKDRACVEECPVDCIYEGGRSLYIHPDIPLVHGLPSHPMEG
jgi:NAD-dependent dihydropyrimidine dehydrogenase PreA subunit